MRTDVVVFDLDGTLVDHEGAVVCALHDWLPRIGVAPDAVPPLVSSWFAAEERHFASWRSGEISFAEQRRRRLRDVLPLIGRAVPDDAELDRIFEDFLHAYERGWRAFDDAIPCLDTLAAHGLRLAVLTNGTQTQQTEKLRRTGLDGYVERVFTAEGLGVAKPRPEVYLRVCAALGVEPSHTLHVGDHPDLDVRAPREVGLQVLHLDRHDTHLASPRISTLRDLPRLLDGQSKIAGTALN